MRSEPRRVVVTGIGLVSPLGVGARETWDALLAGGSGVGPITRFDASVFTTQIAGEVRGFDPEQFMERKAARRLDAVVQFAIAAARLAVADARLDAEPVASERLGVAIAAGTGVDVIGDEHVTLLEKGPGRVSPFLILSTVATMAGCHVGLAVGARGPLLAPSTACAAGLDAIGQAFRTIQLGAADAMLAGGAQHPVTPLWLAGFSAMRALSTRNGEPARASRPWDRQRDGFVLAEGAAVLVLETLDRARARDAAVYAELVGYGSSSDAYHATAPDPDGKGAARAMVAALEDASMIPERVGYINAHATSTPAGDLAELRGIRLALGEHAGRVAVSSTKGSTGHLLAASGALEAAFLALALANQVLPPTLNLDEPEEGADLFHLVPHLARPAQFEAGLTNSLGFGGVNACVAMRRADR